jgi:hypothetical protein
MRATPGWLERPRFAPGSAVYSRTMKHEFTAVVERDGPWFESP